MNIFYFAYDHQKPTGGQKAVYRHVDILNRNGIRAFALHMTEGLRLGWFGNTTAVIGPGEFRKIYNVNEDVIVLPEDLGKNILTFPGKKVIINQGPYLGFYAYGFDQPKPYPYLDPSVAGVFVKSAHSTQYLSFAFPNAKIIRIFDGIDKERFPFRPMAQKKKLIAAPPNKNQMELTQVYNILMARSQQRLNLLHDWEWVFIENKSEAEVAKILFDSALFVFLSTIEGFGILPLEAMLSGAVVAAYDIPPLTEYLSAENSLLTKRGDIEGIVTMIERAVAMYEAHSSGLEARALPARKTAERFSLKQEEESVLQGWKEVLR